MGLLNRILSGLVFKDDFSSTVLNEMWQVSPSNPSRYSLTDVPGVLRLKHGEPDVYVLMNAPRFDFVFEADTNYAPTRPLDQGGLVAFRDKDTRVELLEYYDPATGTTYAYDRLRMVRKGDLVEGYGTNDNGSTWELIGVTFINAPKIGFVLHGVQETQSVPLDIKEMRMYRSTLIQIGNVVEGMRAVLLNEYNNVLRDEICKKDRDHIDLDVSTLQMPIKAKLRLYDAMGSLIEETPVMTDIWGGDLFWYGVKLDVEIDGTLLRQDREFQLGNMQGGVIEKKIYIINNNDISIPNVRISVEAYSDYFGWQWVDVARDVFGQPGSYQDAIYVGNMMPNDRTPVWIKIKRQPEQQFASLNDYKFRLAVESG
jgi:hypothetical protein